MKTTGVAIGHQHYPDIVDDLLHVVLHKTLRDFEFVGYNWILSLLAQYVKQNYDINISITTIASILKDNRLSYKKAQPKPTKADKTEQEDFKKMMKIIDSLESSTDTVVYALDETKVCVESDSRSYRPSPILEKNGVKQGINIVGSTCILSSSHTVALR